MFCTPLYNNCWDFFFLNITVRIKWIFDFMKNVFFFFLFFRVIILRNSKFVLTPRFANGKINFLNINYYTLFFFQWFPVKANFLKMSVVKSSVLDHTRFTAKVYPCHTYTAHMDIYFLRSRFSHDTCILW